MKRFLITFVATLPLILATAARAESIIDFNMDAVHPGSASISYAGGATALVGTNISVDFATGLNTPANNGVSLPITNGLLSFTTGNLVDSSPVLWEFGAGGNITITGDIGSGIVPLMTGTFTSALVVNGSSIKVAIADFVDTKDAGLASYFGLSGNADWSGRLNLSFVAQGNPPGGFSSTEVLSGDVVNVVPEPSSILVGAIGALGLVVAGLGTKVRRSRKTTSA